MIDSTQASVALYLPRTQWDYLRWLLAQGFDLDRYIRACDRRRRLLSASDLPKDVSLADFVSFATTRLERLHYCWHAERTNLVQPVFPHQMAKAIEKAERFFAKSGPRALSWPNTLT